MKRWKDSISWKKSIPWMALWMAALMLGTVCLASAMLPVQATQGEIGQVDVSIAAALVLQGDMVFQVSLTDSQGKVNGPKVITLKGEQESEENRRPKEGRASFTGLREGTYVLKVSGKGFAAYTQSIEVAGRESVQLTTGFLAEYKNLVYEKGAVHPGVLLIGDVDGDGDVDDADRDVLIAVLEGKRASGPVTDLNCDGKTDLADLEYFAKGYREERDTLAWVERSVSPAAVQVSKAGNTKVDGDVKEVLTGRSGGVSLKSANGQAISRDNPVGLEFSLAAAGKAGTADGIVIGTGDTSVTSASVEITYVDSAGKEWTKEIGGEAEVHPLRSDAFDIRLSEEKGKILVYLGSQIAIKKVTLKITGVEGGKSLAEISKVEFLNGMENRIPEPQMDIPENLTAAAGSKKISLRWDASVNVTGYEVKVELLDGAGKAVKSEKVPVAKNALDIASFGGKELVNYKTYSIQVQSVNGTWRSGYCKAVQAVPKPSGKPDKPDNVSASGGYRCITVSWKQMNDTLTYNLYYKKRGGSAYQKVEGIAQNSYTVTGLEDLTEYECYVTGVNEFGESGPSLSAAAMTTNLDPVVMPKYGMINIGEKGEAGAHIVSVTMNGRMEDSPLDTKPGTAWGTVDFNAKSYYAKDSWEDGGWDILRSGYGLVYEFDQAYEMDTFAFHDSTSQDTGIFYVRARYWDENGKEGVLDRTHPQQKRDKYGKLYFVVKLPEAVKVKKLQFGLARYAAQGNLITVSEVYFYHFDTLTRDIMALYEDDLHTVLRKGVTQAAIDALRTRLNTVHAPSGEYHPDREVLERELQTAEAILRDTKLRDSVEVHNGITTKDAGRGFGGLNAWQPLGVAAAAQEEIVVYVGHSTKRTGEDAELQLVATQYHSEAAALSSSIGSLKIGPNKITVPKIGSTTGVESGGALYIQYTGGGDAGDRYAVRVSGGAQVPKLDLYRVTDEGERLSRAKAYVEELDKFVKKMPELHGDIHQSSQNKQVAYGYDAQNCILGASDILLDTMMLSLPASQILAGTGSGETQARAQKLLDSMKAVEDMMYLFYQHKGLNKNAEAVLHQIPKGHLNIRYQRMFSGAFMYAAGSHIGIEWGSASGMISCGGVRADSSGRYQSGEYFGWGIAHEIGHNINQGSYAVAEVTNNYFSVLAQAKETNGSVRFQYENVYKKVTSGAKGQASNVFTQLGMYWQLHLAYDKGYNYKTYADYQQQLASLFFARVDTYARDQSKAPAPGGVALQLAKDRDQDLMLLSCAAAERNILEFFERWGMTPAAATRKYAEQFEKETRAIYYTCDDARAYSLKGGESRLGTSGKVEAVGDVALQVNSTVKNQVDFALKAKDTVPAEDILGYEIVRCMYSEGKVVKETAGFVTGSSFSDTVYANNRVVWYEVTLIDKYLNRSAVKVLEPVKIEHKGELDKTFWTVSTKNLTAQGEPGDAKEKDSSCEPAKEDLAGRLIDGKANTVYAASAGGTAEIQIEFHRTLTVAGFKYQGVEGSAGNYRIEVLADGQWKQAAAGSFGASGAIAFANPKNEYVSTYEATAVKLVLEGAGKLSIGELDVLGVTGDNVDFRRTGSGTVAIGTLSKDYKYGDNADDRIPAGSIVFTGSYKGNPAYNVVVLYDADGGIVGGVDSKGSLKAQQVILAPVPEKGDIRNVSDGTWIYWIEPGDSANLAGKKVRAELYRVNNAQNNEGQRLVSDSLFETVPGTLPEIQFDGGAPRQQ